MASAAGGKRARPLDAPADEEEDDLNDADAANMTPLQRELLHTSQERAGILTFPIVYNDGTPEALVSLIQLKTIYYNQLPKMPKEYISRLVLDRRHVSLVCTSRGEIVGGITYRPVESQALSEIVFCAVSAKHQVQGYGTRIMNQIKEECKRTNIEGMLTYADNHAVGYFRKQGFKKNVTMKRERWQGFLKDYEGATLMECLVDNTIDYLSTRQVAEGQRKAVVKRIAELGSGGGYGANKEGVEAAHRELLRTGWKPPIVEITVGGAAVPQQRYFSEFVDAVCTHADAWPFQHAVSVADAPDYCAPRPRENPSRPCAPPASRARALCDCSLVRARA